MLPIPSKPAIITFIGAVIMMAIAIIQISPTVMIIANVWLLLLCFSAMVTIPIGSRLRRQRLEFAWWIAHKESLTSVATVVPNTPFEIKCYLRWWGKDTLRLTSIQPIIPNDAKLLNNKNKTLVLLPEARTEFSFTMNAAAPGRIVLQGLAVSVCGPAGFFNAPIYFPNPIAIKVLPRSFIRLTRVQKTITGQSTEKSGQTLMQQHSDGVILKEIRELQPGDPYKAIAWKASARAGKLMVREVEQEVQETAYIILDISGTMRGGEPGNRKLDMAIEIAATAARHAIDKGDRIGLITVDGRITSHLIPKEGPKQMLQIYDSLLATTEVVDKDLTEVDDTELVSKVGQYIRHQDGIDFSSSEGFNKSYVVAYIKKIMHSNRNESRVRSSMDPDPSSAFLRRYCQLRGLPLKYRSDGDNNRKCIGLSNALQEAGGRTRMPQSIMVLTDLDEILNLEPMLKTLRLLRAHHHNIFFFFPNAKSFAKIPDKRLDKDLQQIYDMYEIRRHLEARSVLGKMGIPLIAFSKNDAPSTVIGRAYSIRRVA